MTAGFTPFSDRGVMPAAIISVNAAGRRAVASTRYGTTITIDTSYHVGGLQVTPAIGEQWYVQRIRGDYRLMSRIPFNDLTQLVEPTQGQVQVGSTGPLELHGAPINAHGPVGLPAYASADRPAAATLPAGATIFDTTLGKPLFSDGSVWVDAAGTPI